MKFIESVTESVTIACGLLAPFIGLVFALQVIKGTFALDTLLNGMDTVEKVFRIFP